MILNLVMKPFDSKTGAIMWSEHEPEKTRLGHHASALARRPTTDQELVTTFRMVAERLVASLRSLHGWWTLLPAQSGSRWTKLLTSLQRRILRGSRLPSCLRTETDTRIGFKCC